MSRFDAPVLQGHVALFGKEYPKPGEPRAMADEAKKEPASQAPSEGAEGVLEQRKAPIPTDPSTPMIYANAFGLGLGNADMHILFLLESKQVAAVHLSYTLAKTLHERLGRLVTEFEARVDRRMLTTNEVDAAFERKGK